MYRWVVFGLLGVVSAINFFDRSVISVATVPVMKEFHLNPAQFGTVLSAFFWGLVPAALAAGYLSDRWGPKLVQSLGTGWWSVFTVVTALAGGFGTLIAARALFGIGEGPSSCIDSRMVANWAPPRERGKGWAASTVGVFVAPAIGPPILAPIIAAYGWRTAFYGLGALGLLWVVLWQVVSSDRPDQNRFTSPEERRLIAEDRTEREAAARRSRSFREALPSLATIGWAEFCFGYTLWFLLTWLPGYFALQRHLSLQAMGVAAGIPWWGAVLGTLVGGTLTDRLLRWSGSMRVARAYQASACFLVVAAALYAGVVVESLVGAVALLTLASLAMSLIGPATNSTVIDVASARAGTFGGMIQVARTVPGILAPLVTGVLVASTGSFFAAFVVTSVLMVAGAVVCFAFLHRHTEAEMPAAVAG